MNAEQLKLRHYPNHLLLTGRGVLTGNQLEMSFIRELTFTACRLLDWNRGVKCVRVRPQI